MTAWTPAKLAELLRHNQLRSVDHGDHGLRTLKEPVRGYLTITQDLSRVRCDYTAK